MVIGLMYLEYVSSGVVPFVALDFGRDLGSRFLYSKGGPGEADI